MSDEHDMSVKEYAHTLDRMRKWLAFLNNEVFATQKALCSEMSGYNLDAAIEMVKKWAAEHPETENAETQGIANENR